MCDQRTQRLKIRVVGINTLPSTDKMTAFSQRSSKFWTYVCLTWDTWQHLWRTLIQERATVHSRAVKLQCLPSGNLAHSSGQEHCVFCPSAPLQPWPGTQPSEQQPALAPSWHAGGCLCCDKQDNIYCRGNKCQTLHSFPRELIQRCLWIYRMIQKSNMQKNVQGMFIAQPRCAGRAPAAGCQRPAETHPDSTDSSRTSFN